MAERKSSIVPWGMCDALESVPRVITSTVVQILLEGGDDNFLSCNADLLKLSTRRIFK